MSLLGVLSLLKEIQASEMLKVACGCFVHVFKSDFL